MKVWTPRDSAELYNVAGWGHGYFDVNAQGEVVLTPRATSGGELSVKRVVDDLVRRGLAMPLLLRFSDIMRRRMEELHQAFRDKIAEYSYEGRYQLVMPIKVNQQRHVVEELLEYGRPFGLGLEAGSKPELLVAIAMMGDESGAGVLVCNGYKDRDYIETALLAQRLGITALIIIDRFAELELIIEASKRMGLSPNIGVRAKLASKGSGRWAESGGDHSKFGLTAAELVRVVERLGEEGMLDRLVAMHFHVGSQITAIRAIKDAVAEATRIYSDLHKMGAPLGYIDVGGGLAVDYDGSRTNFQASKNYSVEEYAADIVYTLKTILDSEEVPHPIIISESGRALVAHHSVLVFNVLGQTEEQAVPTPARAPDGENDEGDHPVIEEMEHVASSISRKNYQEAYHDAVQLKEDALSLFRHGILNLRQRARVEALFWKAARSIWKLAKEMDYVPEDLDGLDRQLSDTYFCNFSVFQSVPDSWAVKHLFPIMPIHRLGEQPTRRGILADLTCDSDGKINQFIDLHDVKDSLELHTFVPGEAYFLGVFLVGAYQEILGDLHNLFGDVNAVHIRYDPTSGYAVKSIVEGDAVRDVIGYVSYDPRHLMTRLRIAMEHALAKGDMTFEQSAALVRHFEAGMNGYTYLEDEELGTKLMSSMVPRPKLRAVAESEG